LQNGASEDAFTAASIGDVNSARKRSVKKIEAAYYTPLQAHATMEPQDAVADVREDSCDVWLGTQSPTAVQDAAVKVTGLPNDAVTVHQMLVGGGFGRRSDIDAAVEALVLSKRVRRPVKVVWTREDDVTHDMYRPPSVNSLRADLDEQNNLLAVVHRHSGPTIGIQRGYAKRTEADREALDGILEPEYAFPAYRAEFKLVENIPVYFGWWRAVSEGQNRFAQECFIDELAAAISVDPYDYRRRLLTHNPRALHVLDRAASRAHWHATPVPGVARGIAFAPYGKTLVAQVAEVSLTRERAIAVHRVVCAIDCGLIVNPRTVEAQVQGGIVWGMGAAIRHEITITNGSVQQSNFDSYPMLRIDDMPSIETELIESDDDPSGVGEAAVPAIAPAIANAVFALTGTRIRSLPIPKAI
jgi:isoquinoline 1-oxidoreductase beta subunit